MASNCLFFRLPNDNVIMATRKISSRKRNEFFWLTLLTSVLLPLALASAFLLQPRQLATRRFDGAHFPSKYQLMNPLPPRCRNLFDSNLEKEDDCLSVSVSDLSTSELLAELDRRNIRYSPTASRRELEQLLRKNSKIGQANDQSSSTNDNQSSSNIAEMVRELVAAGIRLPPHASRRELEQLWQDYKQGKSAGLVEPENFRGRRKHRVNIPRLLQQLDELGIQYPPGASPATLQRLLQEHGRTPIRRIRPNQSSIPRENTGRNKAESPSQQLHPEISAPQMSTSVLLEKLNKHGIRCSPTATRAELEKLLRDHQDERPRSEPTTLDAASSVSLNESLSSSKDSLHVERQIPIVPIATNDNTARDEQEDKRKSRLEERLRLRGIEYSQTATYDELKQLWRDAIRDKNFVSNELAKTAKKDPPGRKRRQKTKMHPEKSSWSRLYGKSKKKLVSSLFDSLPGYLYSTSGTAKNRLAQVTDKAARKARYYTRNVKDFFAEDEYGIRDADYYYVTKNIPIDVPAEPVISDNNSPPPNTSYNTRPRAHTPHSKNSGNGYPYSADWSEAYGQGTPPGQFRTRKRRPRPRSAAQTTIRYPKPSSPSLYRRKGGGIQRPEKDSAAGSTLFQLPPSTESGDKKDTRSVGTTSSSESTSSSRQHSARQSKKSQKKKRPVYHPYAEDGAPSEAYRDSIDRFGEFIANTAESILWGKLDDEKYSKTDEKISSKAEKTKKKQYKSNRNEAYYQRSQGSWKDRLEERLDAMLGIHKNGEYYKRWVFEEEVDKANEGGNDAFSVAQGRASKKSHRRKKGVYEKPFWEENNLIATLFGKSPPSDYGRIFEGGYLLPICKTIIKSFIVFATTACEWASVRGSLPQPVVVVGVTSCVVSARPGKRLLTLAVVLGIFRIIGELVHEGLHGNEDWEDEKADSEGEMYDGADL